MTNEAERLNGGPIVGYELGTPAKKCRIASTSPEVTCYDPGEPATSQKASPQMQSGSGKSSSAASSSGLAAEPPAAQPSSPAPSDAGSETSAKSESAASVLAMLQHCCSKAGFSNTQEVLEAATSPHGPVSPQLVSPQLTPQLFPEPMPDGSNTQAEQPMQMRQPSIVVGAEGKPQDGQHAPPPSMAPFVPPQSPDTTQKSSMPPQSPSVLSEEFGASSMNHAASLE